MSTRAHLEGRYLKRSRIPGIVTLLGAAVALLACMAGSVTSAWAHSFHYSKVPGEIVGNTTTTQVIKTTFATVTCARGEDKGKIDKAPAEVLKIAMAYQECQEENILHGKVVATVEGAEYEFNANGWVSLLKPITIKTSFCLTTVPTEEGGKAVNNELKTVEYKTITGTPRKIEEVTKVTGIHYQSGCGNGTNGTYEGNKLWEEISGELWWE